MSGPCKQSGFIPISGDLWDEIAISDDLMASAIYELDQAWRDVVEGPRLGPGRRLLWEIRRPERRRENIRRNLADVLDSRRPRRFRR